jgi:hypothetical protein
MIEVLCTLIVAVTVLSLYAMNVTPKILKAQPAKPPPTGKWPPPPLPPMLPLDQLLGDAACVPECKHPAPGADKVVVPKLAKEYLDASKKLIRKAQKADMDDYPASAKSYRESSKICRDKAERLINGESIEEDV